MKLTREVRIIILLFCFSSALYSQEENKEFFSKKHEINLGAANLFARDQSENYNYYYYPYYLNSSMPYPYYYYPVSYYQKPSVGVGYKYHFHNNALRVKLDFSSSKSTNNNNANTSNFYSTKEKNLSYEIKLGYERQINFQRTQIFYGSDILYNTWDFSSESINSNYWNKTEYNKFGYGISPFIGVKIFITPFLSFSAETNFEYEKYKSTTKNSYSSGSDNINEEKGDNFSFGPIGLISINVHL